jgi:choline kinase
MSAKRPTKAIIIAAGRGKRLMPYTDEMPKCLVPIDGASILARQLEAFRQHGVDDIVIIRGYLGHVIEARVGELGPSRIRFVDNLDYEHNNILESLFCAEAELEGPVLLTYSDIIFTPEVVRRAVDSDADIGLVIDREFASIYEGRTEHPLQEAEVADLTETGAVHRVGKRALPPEDAYGEFIGLATLSATGATWMREGWRRLGEEFRGRTDQPFQRADRFRNAYLTDLLQQLIVDGKRLMPVTIEGQWREIDTVQDLQRAEELLRCAKEQWK